MLPGTISRAMTSHKDQHYTKGKGVVPYLTPPPPPPLVEANEKGAFRGALDFGRPIIEYDFTLQEMYNKGKQEVLCNKVCHAQDWYVTHKTGMSRTRRVCHAQDGYVCVELGGR